MTSATTAEELVVARAAEQHAVEQLGGGQCAVGFVEKLVSSPRRPNAWIPLVLAIIAMVVVLSKIGRGADAREP
jgi:hypothetical protein